jgi:hypothetical protein
MKKRSGARLRAQRDASNPSEHKKSAARETSFPRRV